MKIVRRSRVVRVNGVELCCETFGEPGAGAVLLIGGACSSMDWWEDEFCDRLAHGNRYVIRYDHRDTGASTHYPARCPGYTGADLAEDAVALLGVLEAREAHLVGVSMGAAIALRAALTHPQRVASLALIAGSPGDRDLPAMSPALAQALGQQRPVADWHDERAVEQYLLESLRPFAGSLGVDEERARRVIHRVVERTIDLQASMTNHRVLNGGDTPLRPQLGRVHKPTLVIHGTDDPLFPVRHAHAMQDAIAGSQLLLLDGVGHEVPPPAVWDVVIPALLKHTSRRAHAHGG